MAAGSFLSWLKRLFGGKAGKTPIPTPVAADRRFAVVLLEDGSGLGFATAWLLLRDRHLPGEQVAVVVTPEAAPWPGTYPVSGWPWGSDSLLSLAPLASAAPQTGPDSLALLRQAWTHWPIWLGREGLGLEGAVGEEERLGRGKVQVVALGAAGALAVARRLEALKALAADAGAVPDWQAIPPMALPMPPGASLSASGDLLPAGAWHCEGVPLLAPTQVLPALAEAVALQGARLLVPGAVTGLHVEAGQVQGLETATGPIRAERLGLTLAAGAGALLAPHAPDSAARLVPASMTVLTTLAEQPCAPLGLVALIEDPEAALMITRGRNGAWTIAQQHGLALSPSRSLSPSLSLGASLPLSDPLAALGQETTALEGVGGEDGSVFLGAALAEATGPDSLRFAREIGLAAAATGLAPDLAGLAVAGRCHLPLEREHQGRPLVGPGPLPGLFLSCGWGAATFAALPAAASHLAGALAGASARVVPAASPSAASPSAAAVDAAAAAEAESGAPMTSTPGTSPSPAETAPPPAREEGGAA